jgi:hypothetical protein
MTGLAGLDELSKVGLAADLVPDETQPRQGFVDQLALCGRLTRQHAVVGIWVMAPRRWNRCPNRSILSSTACEERLALAA